MEEQTQQPVQQASQVTPDQVSAQAQPVKKVPMLHQKPVLAGIAAFVIVLVGGGLLLLISHNNSSSDIAANTPTQQVVSTPQPTPDQTVVTPVPMQTKKDVTNALNEIDNTNPSSLQGDLDQNSVDASSFGQ